MKANTKVRPRLVQVDIWSQYETEHQVYIARAEAFRISSFDKIREGATMRVRDMVVEALNRAEDKGHIVEFLESLGFTSDTGEVFVHPSSPRDIVFQEARRIVDELTGRLPDGIRSPDRGTGAALDQMLTPASCTEFLPLPSHRDARCSA